MGKLPWVERRSKDAGVAEIVVCSYPKWKKPPWWKGYGIFKGEYRGGSSFQDRGVVLMGGQGETHEYPVTLQPPSHAVRTL